MTCSCGSHIKLTITENLFQIVWHYFILLFAFLLREFLHLIPCLLWQQWIISIIGPAYRLKQVRCWLVQCLKPLIATDCLLCLFAPIWGEHQPEAIDWFLRLNPMIFLRKIMKGVLAYVNQRLLYLVYLQVPLDPCH